MGTNITKTSTSSAQAHKNATQKLDKNTFGSLVKAGSNQNDVTVIHADGKKEKVTGYIKDGVTYVANKDGSGERLVDGGLGNAIYKADQISNLNGSKVRDSNGNISGNTAYQTEIYLKGPEKKSSSKSSKKSKPAGPPMPSFPGRPAITKYDSPMPSFASDLQKVSKYSYFFGIDKFKPQFKIINQVCAFVSQEISIGKLKEEEYIQIEAKHVQDAHSSIEFYIIDGSMEIPILPVDDTVVFNEKIFFGLRPRFSVDMTKPIEIKQNGSVSDKTLEQAIQSNTESYTVSYSPVDAYSYTPLNRVVKLKIIQRLYDKEFQAPMVSKIKIRKYGGNALWKDDISIL